jgi:hypothetical protein
MHSENGRLLLNERSLRETMGTRLDGDDEGKKKETEAV